MRPGLGLGRSPRRDALRPCGSAHGRGLRSGRALDVPVGLLREASQRGALGQRLLGDPLGVLAHAPEEEVEGGAPPVGGEVGLDFLGGAREAVIGVLREVGREVRVELGLEAQALVLAIGRPRLTQQALLEPTACVELQPRLVAEQLCTATVRSHTY